MWTYIFWAIDIQLQLTQLISVYGIQITWFLVKLICQTMWNKWWYKQKQNNDIELIVLQPVNQPITEDEEFELVTFNHLNK